MEEKIGNLHKDSDYFFLADKIHFSVLVGRCSQMNKWNPHLHRSLPVWVEKDAGPGKQSSSSPNVIRKTEQ